MLPSRYCDFLEELVGEDGIKTLDLYLRATCRGLVLLVLVAFVVDVHITMYSLILTR